MYDQAILSIIQEVNREVLKDGKKFSLSSFALGPA
jgi:hypothetical protein